MKYFLLRGNFVIYLFDVVTIFYDVRVTLYFGTLELLVEVTLQLSFVFGRNHVTYLFDVVMFFYDVEITLYFGMFELRMEVTLQLRFVFVRHCDVFFITSQLNVRCRYVF